MSQVYLVYMHTAPNGKAYIGRTKNYNRRCADHKYGNKCRLLQESIKEFGWDNLEHKILKDNLSLEDANFWEKFYINHYKTFEPNGLNMQTGGSDCKYSETAKAKMSEKKKGKPSWNTGKKLSAEHIRKSTLAKIGRKQSKEQIEKRVSKLRGKPRDKVMMEKLRQTCIGRKYSTETLQRMSEGQKRRFAKARGEIV
jgi:group I intron endonuclease